MKPIFSRNSDIDKIAFVNWRTGVDSLLNDKNIGEGFLKSSLALARLCLINNNDKSADILIFPILTNANHGIELYLKSLDYLLSKISGTNEKYTVTHDINLLFSNVREKIKALGPKSKIEDEFDEATKGLSLYISELYSKIGTTRNKPNMDFSRYSMNSRNDYHFYVSEIGNVEIDLENFILRFEEIFLALDNIFSFLYHNVYEEEME